MNELFERFIDVIDGSRGIVFFGGAGVSTESNIPDFRSETGLYKARQEYGMSPEQMLSHSFFVRDTETFFDYYKKNLIYPDAVPNDAHIGIAALEKAGKLNAVVTQNIDGLHQAAGSRQVYELHGAVSRNYCMDCGEYHELEYILDEDNCKDGVPMCRRCGGIVKPDVVLYEEPLNDAVVTGAVDAISNADTLIIGGTSLAVYPAAGMVNYFKGRNLVLINKQPTAQDANADIVFHIAIGEVFRKVLAMYGDKL